MIEKKHLHEEFTVPKAGKQVRLDHFLSLNLPNKSRNIIQKKIKTEMVTVNDKKSKASYLVKPDDIIRWYEPFNKLTELLDYDYPLEVLHEDSECIVINKPALMPMHPGLGNYGNTVQNALKTYYRKTDQKDVLLKDCIVQRLDKDTSGVLVLAKTEHARQFLSQQFKKMKPYRIYNALVWGNVKEDQGTIHQHIGRHPENERSIEVSVDKSFGKEAVTHYKVLQRYSKFTLVECRLETGRTHQIRVHMQFLGHPLVGDQRYEVSYLILDRKIQNQIGRHCLHAKTLHFISPLDQNTVLEFDSVLPLDITALIKSV
ncbi:RluA family pseudouridine synthase [Flammeovirga aprica]|uniref:Pseudouridine synthase n=1 Tax=Flammeovirga aprica JL-4 TaxID=694437 RepID=A0A7X9P2K2_9BACT|nr:RluA family pseudouridine synthase [Flammeovirga aprica]NME68391.1 RluA family pseudouridine synthase [Flammeovirga aprica JL-4]